MATPLRMPDSPAYRQAEAIVAALRGAGHEALLAGGCVRDLVLAVSPKDFDVATSATPAEVRACFPHTVAVGEAFGVILVVQDGHPVEVATFRTDGPYKDGRHPEHVAYTRDARADVQRRDFTLNALLYDPATHELVDHVGGQADLARRIVRAVGDPRARFVEDRLRMLRAVRFACRLGFTIEADTLAAIREQAAQVTVVSPERIRDECEKMWTGPDPGRALAMLDETGLLAAVLPEVSALRGVAQPPDYHPEGDVLLHTRLALAALPAGRSAVLAWGTLLHDVGKPATASRDANGRIHFLRHDEVGATMAEAIGERLRFSRALRDGVVALVRHHLRFFDAPAMKPSTLKRFLREPGFDEMLALHRADVMASHGRLRTWEFCRRALSETPADVLRPTPLLRGDDVIALGVPRGPQVGEALAALEEAQLDGTVTTRADAEALLRARFAPR